MNTLNIASAAEVDGLPTKAELQRLTDALKAVRGAVHAAIVGQEPDDSAVAHIIAWRSQRISLHPAMTLHSEFKTGDRAAFLSTEDGIKPLPAGKFWDSADAKRAFIFDALSMRTSRAGTSSIETQSGTVMLRITDVERFGADYLAKIGFAEQRTPPEPGISAADQEPMPPTASAAPKSRKRYQPYLNQWLEPQPLPVLIKIGAGAKAKEFWNHCREKPELARLLPKRWRDIVGSVCTHIQTRQRDARARKSGSAIKRQ